MAQSTCSTVGEESPVSAYKAAYNRHRCRPNDPLYKGDFDDLVDFSTKFDSDPRVTKLLNLNDHTVEKNNNQRCNDNVTLAHQGPLCGIKSHPGFVYAPQALGPSIQNLLAFKALTEFCEAPHMTNIDLVPRKEELEMDNGNLTMWNLWKKNLGYMNEKRSETKCSTLLTKEKDGMTGKKTKSKMLQNKERYYRCFGKLSWATMGYHYDWTSRAYREEKKSIMPLLLDVLGSSFAVLDHMLNSKCTKDYPSELSNDYRFTSSASIVNYYSTKSKMGGHRDDLELDFTKPVVSINLGLPAIFLLGGKSPDDDIVVPILVRPGDVMLLAGESRVCFHGMARVIPHGVLPPLERSNVIKDQDKFQIQSLQSILRERSGNNLSKVNVEVPSLDSATLDKFLSEYRINVNIRQVLPDDTDRIPDK